MSFEARARASARRVVGHFGEGLTVTIRSVGGTLNTSTRGMTASVTSMTVPCTEPEPDVLRLADGSRVETGELVILLEAGNPSLTFEPQPEMVAEIRSKSYRIARAQREAGGFSLRLVGAK